MECCAPCGSSNQSLDCEGQPYMSTSLTASLRVGARAMTALLQSGKTTAGKVGEIVGQRSLITPCTIQGIMHKT
jgi:hypothetical protein